MNSEAFQVNWEYEDEYYLYGRGEGTPLLFPLEEVTEFDWMDGVSNAVYKIVCETLDQKIDSSLCSDEDGLNIYANNIPVVINALSMLTHTGLYKVDIELRPHVWGVFTETSCKRILRDYNLKINKKNTYQKCISEKLCGTEKVYGNFQEILSTLTDAYDIEF